MLEIRKICTGYGKKQVLYDLSLSVYENEIVSLIGPNGAGKSTVLKSAFGLIPAWQGEILFDGAPVNSKKPAQNVERGITLAPQGSRVFDALTVKENLEIGGFQLPRHRVKGRIDQVLKSFPALESRLGQEAGRLSGGEQQMLSLARALIAEPKLLLLDEPSLGLSPHIVSDIFDKIAEINRDLGVSMLIVEHKVLAVLGICSRVYSMKLGKLSFDGSADELRTDSRKLKQLFL